MGLPGAKAQIARTISHITGSPSNGKAVLIISTDLTKTFDSVNHEVMVFKIVKLGVPFDIIQADKLCNLNRISKPILAKVKAQWMTNTLQKFYEDWGFQCNKSRTEVLIFSKT